MTAPTIPDVLGTPAERVGLGAQWLDHVDHLLGQPSWWRLIDLIRLDMGSQTKDILGQLFGSFMRAPISLDQAVAFGFDATGDGGEEGEADEYAALHDAWVDLITERREGTQPA